jgi:hypothetical protein
MTVGADLDPQPLPNVSHCHTGNQKNSLKIGVFRQSTFHTTNLKKGIFTTKLNLSKFSSAGVAQLVEHLPSKQNVASSNLVPRSIRKPN